MCKVGLSRTAIASRVGHGWLRRVHHGVYAIGDLTPHGRMWAALLACGHVGSAVLSHRAAAAVWDLLPWPGGVIDVTSLRACRSRRGIRVHRSRTVRPRRDVTKLNGLPVTTVARTIIDLADVLTAVELERVIHRAAVRGLLDFSKLTPPPGRRSRALGAALATLERAEPLITESQLAERFLQLVLASDLPRPQTEVGLLGHRVDFFWPDHALVVETDGRGPHGTPEAFEDDRRRDAELQSAGYRVVRFTWRQVVDEPEYVLGRLRALLATPARARP